jgi:hypothetical protein
MALRCRRIDPAARTVCCPAARSRRWHGGNRSAAPTGDGAAIEKRRFIETARCTASQHRDG